MSGTCSFRGVVTSPLALRGPGESPRKAELVCCQEQGRKGHSPLLLYLHAKVKAHPARPEVSFTPCTAGAAVEQGTGKEKQQEQQEHVKHGPGARDGGKVTAISSAKNQNSTLDIFKFVVYSQFLQHSLFSAGEKLNQKDTNTLGHSFLSKRKSSTQLISPAKHPLKGC